MPTFRSGDAQLSYEVAGDGPDVVLLHPFPLNRHFWTAITPQLSPRYRVILPDLRGHGDSELGEGPVTMQKLADDLSLLCREEKISKAFFVGVSIGGYLLFEFWRRYRDQFAALVLANTRPGADRDGLFAEKWEVTRIDGVLRAKIVIEHGAEWVRKNPDADPVVFKCQDPEFVSTALATTSLAGRNPARSVPHPGWKPNHRFDVPVAIIDPNGNIQIMSAVKQPNGSTHTDFGCWNILNKHFGDAPSTPQ
jgi:pimeloyl-ACP methyl ester carboxylesterase